MIEYNLKRLEKVYSSLKEYAPVIAMSFLILLSVVSAGGLYTQPFTDTGYSSVEAQQPENVLYVGDTSGIKALDPLDGSLIWEKDLSVSGTINDIEVSNDGSKIYFGTGDGRVMSMYTSNQSLEWEYLYSSVVNDVSPSESNGVLYATANEDTVKEINIENGNELNSYDLGDWGEAVDVNPSETTFYSSESGVHRARWVSNGSQRWAEVVGPSTPRELSFSESGETMYVAGDSSVLEIDPTDGTPGNSFDGHDALVTDITNEIDGFIYTSSADDTVKKVNTDTLSNSEWTFENHTDAVTGVAKRFDRVYTVSNDRSVKALDDSNGEEIWTYDELDGDVGPGSIEFYGSDLPENGGDFDPELQIYTRNYIEHGNTAAYEIYYTNPDNGTTTIVNGESGVSLNSSNTSVFTVDTTNSNLVATNDTSINQREQFTVEYEGLETQENVTVANQTVENLPILPGITRVGATYSDTNIAMILVGTLLGVVATRVSSAFAGIGTIQLTLVAGFFVDLVSLGVVLVGLFGAMFIGLNLAANIDYAVSR